MTTLEGHSLHCYKRHLLEQNISKQSLQEIRNDSIFFPPPLLSLAHRPCCLSLFLSFRLCFGVLPFVRLENSEFFLQIFDLLSGIPQILRQQSSLVGSPPDLSLKPFGGVRFRVRLEIFGAGRSRVQLVNCFVLRRDLRVSSSVPRLVRRKLEVIQMRSVIASAEPAMLRNGFSPKTSEIICSVGC